MDIINEGGGIVGVVLHLSLVYGCIVRHTSVSVIPFPSVAAWQLIPTIIGNEGLFMCLFIYLFTYLCSSDKASEWWGTI